MLKHAEAAFTRDAPLPADRPHVAYVLLWYPLFTQPFIFREVECLSQVLPLKVYTLYGASHRHLSKEMGHSRCDIQTYGLRAIPAVLAALAWQAFRNPRGLWRLFRQRLCHRWASIEMFCENFWAFCVGVSLGRRFCEDGIDFVYAPWPRGAATAALVGAGLAGLPFATAARGDNLNPADPDLGAKLAAAAFVRANNAADQKRIEAFDKEQARGKTILIYNSLSLPGRPGAARKTILQGDSTVRLLALGRFDVTKGFDVLLRACAILKQRGLDFRLTLAGGGGKVLGLGDMAKVLNELRSSLHLEDVVAMPGLLSHDELPRILERHDIFVAPCVIHSSGRRDGIPNTVIEAMSYGLPVVSTTVNGLPEIVRHGQTGLAVAPNDPQALAEAIIWLCGHHEEARKLAENGAALAAEMFEPMLNARRFAAVFIKKHAERQKRKSGCGADPCAE